MPPVRPSRVATPYGEVSLVEQGEGARAVVFLHGNSFCKDVFKHQFNAGLERFGRVLALDLPGHGASEDAPDPPAAYCLPGYADAVRWVLEARVVESTVLVGWSLGAHVALELLGEAMETGHTEGLAGLFLHGALPIDPGAFTGPTLPAGGEPYALKRTLDEEDVARFARLAVGERPGPAPFMLAALRRCDGRARELLGASIAAGRGVNRRRVAETSPVPLGVVHGMDDPFIDAATLDGVPFARLWEGRIHALDGVGHAPFWEVPQVYNALLERFLTALQD